MIIAITIIIISERDKSIIPSIPSIADVTDIGGVMIPSASNAAPPIIAGIISHLARFLKIA